MSVPELEQLRMLAQVDELTQRLTRWAEPDTVWQPEQHCRAIVRRLLGRVQTLRVRLEAPLVVATFGGTGTGKSSLVNALIGRECTAAGRQRPTTTRPILIVHPDTEVDSLDLPLDQFEIQTADTAFLRDVVIMDCPDPDTSESDSAASNLARLRQLLPHCDVLIYASTQQKYRSARVTDELGDAAAGCRLLFVQTHADVDEDIRDDWRRQLQGAYEVPEMFFVDSVRALREQQASQRPSGDFSRLLDLLTTQFNTSQRVRVRRANLIDLLDSVLKYCRTNLNEEIPSVQELQTVLETQRRELTELLANQLGEELLVSRHLWERRLLTAVTDVWGFSPFSTIMRFYNGLGGFIASMTLYRARTSAQMALIGAVQGTRWLANRTKQREAEHHLDRVGTFGLDDTRLTESRIVIEGHVKSAKLDVDLSNSSLDALRDRAAKVEDEFLGDARRRVDEIIEFLAIRNSGFVTRAWYEFLFLAYLGFVLYRVGKNFFYDSFLRDLIADTPPEVPAKMLTMDFYIPAAIFFLLWAGVLLMAFTRRLRRGLQSRVEELAQQMAELRVANGLYPHLEDTCHQAMASQSRIEAIAASADALRRQVATDSAPLLGGRVSAETEPASSARS